MRYRVELAGRNYSLDLREGPQGLEAALGEDEHRPVRLRPGPAPLYTLEFGERRVRLVLAPDPLAPGSYLVAPTGERPLSALPLDERAVAAGGRQGARKRAQKHLRAAMPGVVVELRVAEGDRVEAGQVLLILEAMKMQNEIAAPADARVAAVRVQTGDAVAGGDVLVEFAPLPADGED